VYLSGELTVAEIRALVTLGLEHGMMRETCAIQIREPWISEEEPP
jgi:hypothetical protein